MAPVSSKRPIDSAGKLHKAVDEARRASRPPNVSSPEASCADRAVVDKAHNAADGARLTD